jgi:uncharacterized protein (DUF1697 family)
MARYIAFLRAINVGGHVVKMQRLKALFQALGFMGVETFIASGNVIFHSRSKSAATLETKIEAHLQGELGYEVKTFIRTDAEVREISAHSPFEEAAPSAVSTLYIGLLKNAPTRDAIERLLGANSDVDDFSIHGRQLYWRCRVSSQESAFSGAKLEKLLGMPITLRNANTLRRLAAKCPPARG